MSLIPFPNVPLVSGVPPIPRSPLFPPAAGVALGLLEGMIWRIFQVRTQWGIFDQAGRALGDPALFRGIPGNVLESIGIGSTLSTGSVEYNKETRVSDFPVERGGFASYNKVELPARPVVMMCLDAGEDGRSYFLDALEAATVSTNLYNVVTPEVVYINYAIESYNYQRRASKGCTLIIAEIHLEQVRQISAVFSQVIVNPKDVGATPQSNSGVVQPQAPSTSVLQSVVGAIPGLANGASNFIGGLVQ